jgi:Tfp pilus assembly protein PilF
MRLSTLCLPVKICRFLLLIVPCIFFSTLPAWAQDSGNESIVGRGDRGEISITLRDTAGGALDVPAHIKLLREGMPADQTVAQHGRAFFVFRTLGTYTVIVEAAGYKTAQKDVSMFIAMKTELDVNLQRDSSSADGSAVPGKPLLAPKAQAALDKGIQALSANKLSEAEKYIEEAAKLAPSNPDVLYVQGVLYLKLQKWTRAQAALETAAQMDPTNARVFAALGMALADQGKFDESISPLEKSLQLNPSGYETHWTLAKAYYHHEQYDDALKASQQALSESNGQAPQIELLVAQSLTATGRYEDAAQTLRDFLKTHGDRPEAATARRWLDGLSKNGKIHSN